VREFIDTILVRSGCWAKAALRSAILLVEEELEA
jgi:hypothetical protein